jgi:hypothetical protein
MLITKTNPAGIDVVIQQIQTDLYVYLLAKWGIADADYKCSGRCYRNKQDGNYFAQVYIGGNDYEDATWNDMLKAVSFFGISEIETHKAGEKTDVHLVFFVNIAKLKPAIQHRADEEVRKDVQNFFFQYPGLYKSTELWLENVLKEYRGSSASEGLKVVDMHPIHCFRINLEILYNKNICP